MGNIIQLPKMGLAGEYRIKARKADGSGRERLLADWFSNNIVEVGLDNLVSAGWKQYCHVGTGTVPVTNNDTSLTTPVLSTSAISNIADSTLGSTPYYSQSSCDYTFPVGAGTYTEVGVASGAHDASFVLFSRALIVDSFGDPTAITVLADEYLVVTYRLRNYPPLTDVTGNIGVGSDTHAYTLRAANVNSVNEWAQALRGAGTSFALYNNGGDYYKLQAFSGGIGDITSNPGGDLGEVYASFGHPYVPGSRQYLIDVPFDFSAANVAGYIASLRLLGDHPGTGAPFTKHGIFQIGFNPVIPKDSSIKLTFTVGIGWGRYAP